LTLLLSPISTPLPLTCHHAILLAGRTIYNDINHVDMYFRRIAPIWHASPAIGYAQLSASTPWCPGNLQLSWKRLILDKTGYRIVVVENSPQIP
jgi:hypothetical protein